MIMASALALERGRERVWVHGNVVSIRRGHGHVQTPTWHCSGRRCVLFLVPWRGRAVAVVHWQAPRHDIWERGGL